MSEERVFAATEDGYYFLPKEATTGNPLLNKKIEAMIPSVKSDAAGSHHQEMTQELRPDARIARQPMQDDAGATTGLRRRPDYGESDSLTSELNRANAKGAAAQYVVALDAHSRKEASKRATMFITGIEWKDSTTVAKFSHGPDPVKAVRLGSITAAAVSRQLNGPQFRLKSRTVLVTN